MIKRIFRSICVVAIAVFLASLALIMGVLYDYFSEMQMKQLKVQAELAAKGVENNGISFLTDLRSSDYRITYIAADGSVSYDNEVNIEQMGNHLEREEVQLAMKNGHGESMRYSTTLLERQLYAAEKLSDGSVIRLSGSQYTILTLLLSMMQPIIIVIVIATGISLFLAFRLSKRVVKPLNEMNLDNPETSAVYPELSPMLERLRSQQQQLREQAAELQKKRDEFEAATEDMSEGLVLLSRQDIILSINRTALHILGISTYCIGKDLLLVNNSYEMQEMLRKAQSGEHAEITLHLPSGNYQFNASPVISEGEVSGIALLIIDITEKEKSEQIRREFTANVSHELKTPLHTISGCAELLANSMVKPEDVVLFSEKIFSEAKRMVVLIDDIIKLSHLDEGGEDLKREEVDLYALAEDTIRNLTSAASEANVSLRLSGDSPAYLNGISQLLCAILHNLCDNAIKYNKKGGSVSVNIKMLTDELRLSVEDTGIGIPAEQQERIFERFYRVDKSHSKEVGGTGLGLSIVKHAAKLHNAKITLQSMISVGTTITVTFPLS